MYEEHARPVRATFEEYIEFSRFSDATDKWPKRERLSVDEFLTELVKPQSLEVKAADFSAMSKEERSAAKKKLRAWSPALYPPGGARRKDAVDGISAIVLDVDDDPDATPYGVAERMRLHQMKGAVHTSISDRGEGSTPRKFRVIVLVDRPMRPDEHVAARDEVARRLRVAFDPATRTDHSRIYYCLGVVKGGTYEARIIDGVPCAPLTVGEVLAGAKAYEGVAKAKAGKAGKPLSPALSAGTPRSVPPERETDSDGGGVARKRARPKRKQRADTDSASDSDNERKRLRSALDYLARYKRKPGMDWPGQSGGEFPEGVPCSMGGLAREYDDWFRVGCAIADFDSSGGGLELFDLFSSAARSRYSPSGVRDQWEKIKTNGQGINVAWVFKVARAWGWEDPTPRRTDENALACTLADRWKDRCVVITGAAKEGLLFYRDALGIWRKDELTAKATDDYLVVVDEMEGAGFDARTLHKLRSKRSTDAVIALAARKAQKCPLAEFDADPVLLGVTNGILDIRERRLLTLEEASKRARVARQCGTAWDESAACPKWEEHVRHMCEGDEELMTYMQELVGSSLWGGHARRNMVLGVGPGRNGKSRFQEHLMRVFGDYAAPLDRGALMQKGAGDSGFKLATLIGKRLIFVSETERGETLAAATIKQLIGGDRVQVRGFYSPPTEMAAQFTLFCFSNSRPTVRDDSEGFWDRMRLLPLKAQFSGDVAQATVDAWFEAEHSGILRWAVDGFTSWAARGYKFVVPAVVQRETAGYKSDSDTLGLWIGECAVLSNKDRGGRRFEETTRKLFASYMSWCGTWNVKPLSMQGFVKALGERGVTQRRSSSERYLVGIALLEEAEAAANRTLRLIESRAAEQAWSQAKAA